MAIVAAALASSPAFALFGADPGNYDMALDTSRSQASFVDALNVPGSQVTELMKDTTATEIDNPNDDEVYRLRGNGFGLGGGASWIQQFADGDVQFPDKYDDKAQWFVNPHVTFSRTDSPGAGGTVEVAVNILYKQTGNDIDPTPLTDGDHAVQLLSSMNLGGTDTVLDQGSSVEGADAWRTATSDYQTFNLNSAQELQFYIEQHIAAPELSPFNEALSAFEWRFADNPFTFREPGGGTMGYEYTANSADLGVTNNVFAAPDLRITEAYGGISGPDGTADWIEITNLGDADGYIGHLSLDDTSAAPLNDLANVSLAPGESIIVLTNVESSDEATAIAQFEAIWGAGINVIVAPTDLKIGSTETLRLVDSPYEQVNDDFEAMAEIVTDELSYTSLDSSILATQEDPTGLGPSAYSTLGLNGAYESNPFANDQHGGTMVTLIGSPGYVPEPASLALLAMGGLGLIRRRR